MEKLNRTLVTADKILPLNDLGIILLAEVVLFFQILAYSFFHLKYIQDFARKENLKTMAYPKIRLGSPDEINFGFSYDI